MGILNKIKQKIKPKMKRGLYIVFEGIDGSGTTTQVPILTKYIKDLYKYNDVLETHEPWKSEEIKKELFKSKDAFAEGEKMASLYISDRAKHMRLLMLPVLRSGGVVITDRYIMSTCAYQWTQGVNLQTLMNMHKGKGLIVPDLTILIDVSLKCSKKRKKKRGGQLEKFESDEKFILKLIENYRSLAKMPFFGKVIVINGNQSIEKVTKDIKKIFDPIYQAWKNS